MTNPRTMRLSGRRDQGNQGHRRVKQLQTLTARSNGALDFVSYTRQGAEYRVRLGDEVMILRSADIDPFVTGVEAGIRLMGIVGQPRGAVAAELHRATVEQPLSGLEPAERLPEPAPKATTDGEGLLVTWAHVPGADRYVAQLRNTGLRNPQWKPLGQTTTNYIEAELEPGTTWEVRVRAEDTTGALAVSDWAVAPVTPAPA